MPGFSITVDGNAQLLGAFNVVEQEISDWRPAWEQCEILFQQIEREQFETQGGHGGGRWQSLSSAYAAWKQEKYSGQTILRLHDNLWYALTRASGDNAIREVEKESLTLGATGSGIYHQRGTKRKLANGTEVIMPARPPIVITQADVGKFSNRMLKQMITVGAKAGFQTKVEHGL